MIETVAALGVALVTAFGGAYLGAKWGAERALDRFRSERGFTSRLQWYEDAILLFGEANRTTGEHAFKVALGDAPAERVESRQAALDAVEAALRHVEIGRIYASEAAFSHIAHLHHDVSVTLPVGEHPDAAGEPWDAVAGLFYKARTELMLEARRHLGYETPSLPLKVAEGEEAAWQPED